LTRTDEDRRRAWFAAYVTTILQRDVRDIANLEGISVLPRLLGLLAARSSGLLNVADIARGVGLSYTTLRRYLAVLEAAYLIAPLPAWFANLSSRLVKAQKSVLNDTGLAASLLGADAARILSDGGLFGMLLESFVAMELRKLSGGSRVSPRMYHLRTYRNEEVDIVLEAPDGRLVGIEVKASASVTADAFRGLKALQSLATARFVRGVVLYTGDEVIPFGGALHAIPVSALWA
jgi:predicted AAA+ superfamily ATPase